MKTITRLLATAALLFGVVGGVNSVKASKTIGTKYTNVSQLENKAFAIVNEADAKAIYHRGEPSPYTLGYADYKTAFSASLGYKFKLIVVDDDTDIEADGKYIIRCVNEDGSEYSNSEGRPYLQSNITGKGVCFLWEHGENRGLDAKNTAVWDIEYVVGEGGWTIKNVGTGKYYNDPTKDAMSDTPAYFTFCEVISTDPTITISNAESIAQTLESNPENFTEITQENVETGFTAADKVVEEGYTTYTTKEGVAGHLNIAIKTKDVDVAGCDFVVIKFAEAIAAGGWQVAFWGNNSTESVVVGATEYKLTFAEDPLGTHPTAFKSEGVLKEITLMTLWTNGPITAKVKGVYKHTAIDCSRTYSFNEALDFTDVTGLEAYVITAFDASKGTLTLSRVYQVPANTGLYLVGKGGDYKIPTLDSADPIATNLLKASGDGSLTVTDGDNTNLIFGGSGEDRGFHELAADGNIGENKAYLQLPTTDLNAFFASGARLSLVFEDEATAITKVNEVKAENDAWYTISGMKLNAKPTQRGIYIKNGKKFAIQ